MSDHPLPSPSSATRPVLELRPVLLVDDDESTRNVIDAMLSAAGILNPRIHLGDGCEAQEVLVAALEEGVPPVLIILDANMPRCTGRELLAWMHRDPRLEEVPVIMLTGDSDLDAIAEAYTEGAEFYLVKPIDHDALERSLRELDRPWALG